MTYEDGPRTVRVENLRASRDIQTKSARMNVENRPRIVRTNVATICDPPRRRGLWPPHSGTAARVSRTLGTQVRVLVASVRRWCDTSHSKKINPWNAKGSWNRLIHFTRKLQCQLHKWHENNLITIIMMSYSINIYNGVITGITISYNCTMFNCTLFNIFYIF